jgi:stage II sporulation protein D
MTARLGGLALLLGVVLPALGAAPAAHARARKPAPPLPGLKVDRLRVEPVVPGSPVGVDGVGTYWGALELVRSATGVAVVNDVAFEDYVRGISEVPSSWPAAALEAQAVAARTYALSQMNGANAAAKAVGADICATDSCQVYTGLAKEQAPDGDRWVAAAAATAGQVLLYKGAPIVAKYSASNGGRSIPGGRPYLRAVDDPDDVRAPLHQWRVTLPLDQVAAAFGAPAPILTAARTPDGVAFGWQPALGAPGETAVALADFKAKLRDAFPPPPGMPPGLPSLQFTVAVDPLANALVIDGKGYGHGIGLSQWGTLGKALRGMRAPDILASYYAGLRPVQLPPARLPARIRVAVDLGRLEADLTGDQFRLLDGSGAPLAANGAGRWRVFPGPGHTLRVVAPAGQGAAPAAGTTTTAPPVPAAPAVALGAAEVRAPQALAATHRPRPAPKPWAPAAAAALALLAAARAATRAGRVH